VDEDIVKMIERLRRLENDIERKIEQRRNNFVYEIENRKIIFTSQVLAQQRRLKMSLMTYLVPASRAQLFCVPVIYGLIVPFLLLDISLYLYQQSCFRAWGATAHRAPRLYRVRPAAARLSQCSPKAKLSVLRLRQWFAGDGARNRRSDRTILVPDQTCRTHARRARALSKFSGIRRRRRFPA